MRDRSHDSRDHRDRRDHWKGSGSRAATPFAGNIMTLIAYAMLFDDDEDAGGDPPAES